MTAAAPLQPQSLGSMIDELKSLDNEIKAIAKTAAPLKARYSVLEGQIMATLEREEMPSGSGKTAKAFITEMETYSILNWDELEPYLLENEALHLLKRAISSTAIKELVATGESVPGVEHKVIRKLGLRKI